MRVLLDTLLPTKQILNLLIRNTISSFYGSVVKFLTSQKALIMNTQKLYTKFLLFYHPAKVKLQMIG